MKIWITGCAGFLGRRLLDTLTGQGHEVVGISRRSFSTCSPLASIDLASDKAVTCLTDLATTYGAPDVVVHAATQKPARLPQADFIRSNMLTTANLLDYLDSAPPRRIIYTSTLSVYGKHDTQPVSETASCTSSAVYAKTKRWSEELVEAFSDRSSIVILRLPSLYGHGQEDSFIDGLARLALANEAIELFARGLTIRDAIHIDDAVKAVVSSIALDDSVRCTTLNIGCGQPLTSIQYAEALVAALDSTSKIVPVDRSSPQAFDLYADIRKAQLEIGFEPRPLHQAMEDYVNEIRSAS